jgi:hypothetical protein
MNDQTMASEWLVLEQHYELLRHYSSRLFQAWASGVTVYLLVWAAILNIGPQVGTSVARTAELRDKTFIVFGGIVLITLLYQMSNGYYMKYLIVLRGGRSLEERLFSTEVRTKLFFSNYPSMAHWWVYAFQTLSVLVLSLYGITLKPTWWTVAPSTVLLALLLLTSIRLERFIQRELRS